MLQTGVPALLQWCKQVTSGYPGVSVTDFSNSWRSGLAFCAIIARFRPELIDFDGLDPENSFENLRKAFSVAEDMLGIPALLEVGDLMDTRSVITYLAQFYHKFNKLTPQPALRRSIRKPQDSILSKDSGLEDSLSDSRQSSPLPNSSRTSSPVSSSSSRQSSSEDSHGVTDKENLKKYSSFQSLPRGKEPEKPKLKTLGPKNLNFIAALQKFSNLSSSTPNLHKTEEIAPCPNSKNNSKTRKLHKSGSSRTIETQTETVLISHRGIQTENHRGTSRVNNERLYARSASISNLYNCGNGNAVPNTDKNRTNNLIQGLSRYRASQRILNTTNSKTNYSFYNSCDNLQQQERVVSPPQRTNERKNSYACCKEENWRSNETIGVYNTRHFEHNQDYCNQRYYEPNPLYGYSPHIHHSQGYRTKKHWPDEIIKNEIIYQNTNDPGNRAPAAIYSPCKILYNNKNQTFSTLV